ncbi:MAG: maleylpyruvate isomerase N-terminal domain-containing protein, partial [Actinomycetota bacterium]|nr:maleylpyruvate isomerase N-terminal domain-containing protein [Actinomycetota bacterium]
MDDDVNARLADEYRAARQRTSAIAGELDDDQAALLVPACPDWTVADLLA